MESLIIQMRGDNSYYFRPRCVKRVDILLDRYLPMDCVAVDDDGSPLLGG